MRKRWITAKEGRKVIRAIKIGKANWFNYILRKNCLLRSIIEIKIEEGIEVMGRRRRRKQLRNDLKGMTRR